MQRSTLMSVLRGPDGRALGLPLAVLLLLGFVIGGVSAANLTIDENGFVICGNGPVDSGGALPNGSADHINCCVSGCCPAVLGLLAAAALMLLTLRGSRNLPPRRVFRVIPSLGLFPTARAPPLRFSPA